MIRSLAQVSRHAVSGFRAVAVPGARSSRPVLPAVLPVVAAALLAGCGSDSGSGPPETDYDAIDPIVYSQHVQPIFSMSCNAAACHNASDAPFGLALESWTDVAEGSDFGAVVTPFEADRSHLYLHLTGEIAPRMPLARDPLPEAQIRFLKRWIDEGARNDAQEVMYSDVTRKVFVACQGENAVAVVDLDTGLLARLLRVQAPHSVYVDPARRRLYVTRFENASDNFHVYDADTYELLATAKVGTYPALIESTPDGSQLWVSNFHTGAGNEHKVHVLDPDTLEPLEGTTGGRAIYSFPNVRQPHGLAISSDGARAYVANIETDNLTVYVTDDGTGIPAAIDVAIPLPDAGGTQQPQQCVLSPDDRWLYVSAQDTDTIYILDTESVDDDPGTPVDWRGQVTVGAGPWHLAVSPSGTEVWVANWLDSSVSIVDVTNPDAPVEVARLAPKHPADDELDVLLRPIGIAFSPDGTEVWVASANDDESGGGHHPPPDGDKAPGTVAVFDAATREVKSVAEVPNFARFLSFLP
jgi:DNA-binding beta-propeller fold protein YncE